MIGKDSTTQITHFRKQDLSVLHPIPDEMPPAMNGGPAFIPNSLSADSQMRESLDYHYRAASQLGEITFARGCERLLNIKFATRQRRAMRALHQLQKERKPRLVSGASSPNLGGRRHSLR